MIRLNKGSFTVEAAFVIPVIILVVYGLIFASLLLYQKALIMKVASYAAQQGAETWPDSRKNMSDGSWDGSREKDSMYYRIFNDSLFGLSFSPFSNPYTETLNSGNDLIRARDSAAAESMESKNGIQNRKLARMREAVWNGMLNGLLKPDSVRLRISYENIMVQRKIDISIEQDIKIPFGGIKKLFDGRKTITVKGMGTAVVSEPAEYIRNLDLSLEYAEKIKEKLDIQDRISQLTSKLKGIFPGGK